MTASEKQRSAGEGFQAHSTNEPPARPSAPVEIRAEDWLAAALLWLSAMVVFGVGASRLGFYYDDAVWMTSAPGINPGALWTHMMRYIPGRNLFVLWEFLIYRLLNPLKSLPAVHLAQSAIDGTAAAAFFFLLRSLQLPAAVALLAAGGFALWPVHGETHFWLSSIPANLLSTLFVLLFAITSLSIARRRRAPLWLWALDASAFVAALFTYDQVFFVLVLWITARLALRFFDVGGKGWRSLLSHVPYIAVVIFYLVVKLKMGPEGGPTMRPDLFRVVRDNIAATVSANAGPVALAQLAPLYRRVTASDWLLAAAVASALAGASLWLLERPAGLHSDLAQGTVNDGDGHSSFFPHNGYVFLLGLLFCVAAYLPNWVWWLSPRHHYLPSAGLFMAGAACLAWIFEHTGKAARLAVVLAAGGSAVILAAADRGESRLWEASFTAKRALFAELKPDLLGAELLVLEHFPGMLGDAFFITPHDALYGPQLLYPEANWTGPGYDGSIGSVPAPGGIFYRTQGTYGPLAFRYHAGGKCVVVRCLSAEDGRLHYEKSPERSLPYEIVSAKVQGSGPLPFRARQTSAKPDGENLNVGVGFQAALRPGVSLAAVFSFLHAGQFYRWGRWDSDGFNTFPVMLAADAAAQPAPAGITWDGTLLLHHFPKSDRLRVEFFEVRNDSGPTLLGQSEAAIEP